MAAPPTLNLLREIMLMTRVVARRFIIVVPLGILAFIRAAYSLFLFAATQHGPIRLIVNPLLILSTNFNYTLFLHLIPVVAFILNPILLGVLCF